jgi:glycosyltransferase involved in cell wall biosynthesis
MITQQRLPLSVCMIAGNEAHRIRRSLESVTGWTAEIIIVLNDDVTDGTDKIAAGFGAKVVREPWKGYIAQKNSAAQKANSDWILGLDADEAVSPELRDEIQKLFSKPKKTPAVRCVQFSPSLLVLRTLDSTWGLVSGSLHTALAQGSGGMGRR